MRALPAGGSTAAGHWRPLACCLALGAVLSGVPGATALPQTEVPSRQEATDAVVFLRVMGNLRAEFRGSYRPALEERDVEIATGTGFLVTSEGLLITSQHVVAGRRLRRSIGGADADVTLEVERIEAGVRVSGFLQRLSASVLAEDPELDLALLGVTGSGLPYLPLGDSDAAASGEPTTALGFPLGRAVEVGRAGSPEVVPRLSVSPGALSALRQDASGAARYLQTDATLNPGNSGGPLLDADGYVLGVVEMKLSGGTGLGFAVPVNVVKNFLETTGFLPQLPSRRLRPGPPQSLPAKGLRLRLPEGYEDRTRDRTRLEASRDDGDPRLLLERVVSPWGLDALEEALASGAGFEEPGFVGRAQRRDDGGRPRRMLGSMRGRASDGSPLWMEYALVDLGREKLVARWLAPPDALAFNRSVLRESLASLEADPLLGDEVDGVVDVPLVSVATRVPGVPPARLPEGFWVSEGGGAGCTALPEPAAALVASPAGDFSVVLRWRFWREAPLDAAAAAAACGRTGDAGSGYSVRLERFGVVSVRDGLFKAAAGGLLGLEIEAPLEKRRYLEDLAGRWWTGPIGEAAGY